MEKFLQQTYFNNTVLDYLIAASIVVVSMVVLIFFKRYILKQLKRLSEHTNTNVDNYIVAGLEKFGLPIIMLVVLYAGVRYLELPEKVGQLIRIALATAVAYYTLRLISTTVRLMLETRVRKQENGEEKAKQLGGIMLMLNIFIWGVGILFLFNNLGYNVTTIVAGLGIGGIAIALAAQNILGDLFNYFVIFFDRPIEIGDYIAIDNKSGTVEHIGIKTTRLKSLSGEQLVLSNSDLTKSRIHNYKRMERRRVIFTLGVTYDTPVETLRRIPSIITGIVQSEKGATLDRVHFLAFGDFSLRFEVVFWVESPDFNRYADLHHSINLKIAEAFSDNKIEFAYPTQTVYNGTLKENAQV